jgi:exopolysaccharide production protein ExoZ
MRMLNIEALRFFAALWVVAAHSAGYVQHYSGLAVPGNWFFVAGGFGVDLFFVISGFVIGLSQIQNRKSFRDFVLARLIRIVPAYWVATLSTALVAVVAISVGYKSAAFEGISWPWAAASLGFISQIFYERGPIVYQGWTLEYELFFYACVALGIWFFRNPRLQLAFGSLVVFLAMVFWSGFSIRALGFLVGVVLSMVFVKFQDYVLLRTLAPVIALCGVVFASFQIWGPERSISVSVSVPIYFGFVVFGLAAMPQLRSKAFGLLGASSYAVYLVQVLSIPLIFAGVSTLWGWGQLGPIYFWIVLLGTQVAGILYETVVDKPIGRKLRSYVSGAK